MSRSRRFFGGRVEIFRAFCEKYYPVLDIPASRSGLYSRLINIVGCFKGFDPGRKLCFLNLLSFDLDLLIFPVRKTLTPPPGDGFGRGGSL
jgi:hypothetical protein